MSRAFNFSPGPAALPQAVLEQARDELLEWGNERASVMEISHRGKAFEAMAAQAEQDLRDLLAIPDNYRVLFLQGGASQQFAQVPMNLARPGQPVDCIVTGAWSQKAVAEGAHYAATRIAASSEAEGFTTIPPRSQWQLSPDAAYVHIAGNETIHGVEFFDDPDTGHVPLVSDQSSNILSRPMEVSRYGLIYAGAQKNIGPAGLTIVIVRDDLIQRSPTNIAKLFRYDHVAKENSLLNTPPSFGWYLAGLVFKWLKEQGGLVEIERQNVAKSQALYTAIDGSNGYFRNDVDPRFRSRMNIPFFLHDAALDAAFLEESKAAGLLALKGHRALGGMRASLYNAVPKAAVDALVAFMADFAKRHG